MSVSVGKWTKHKFMAREEELSRHLPDTKLLTEDSLWWMLDQYSHIMIKPCIGYQGRGVIQVSSLPEEKLEIHSGYKKIILHGKRETYDYLKENHLSKKKRYIVQQRIPLAVIGKSPFDIRVMVQRKNDSSEWSITGKLAKVAANGFVITNAVKAVLTVEEAIKESTLNNNQIQGLLGKLDQLSLFTVKKLANDYPKRRTFGIDIGIDQAGEIWIIEVNLAPNTSMFKKLANGDYERIKSYKKEKVQDQD
ncbi:YheC/YheD family protein [Bacillus sp. FJAT-29790]|uniref:YheC/YheD family protein n=1 Tax=Bacillus sp. FJAT-29790 TaxID=1895002 RepID=UPI001C21637A|nr:YheC/YheD family protein [Bacillus sp. FJAT-29790]MBU8879968.1 YheC/YheD family protein [Bacillus sp. FJAT-29790]